MIQPHRRIFQMPPAFTPETKESIDVDAELRQLRRELDHMRKIFMATIQELSSNVQRLIDVATSIKHDRDSAPAQQAAQPDPMVDELNQRIVHAIEVLSGTGEQAAQPVTPADPNAPVTIP